MAKKLAQRMNDPTRPKNSIFTPNQTLDYDHNDADEFEAKMNRCRGKKTV